MQNSPETRIHKNAVKAWRITTGLSGLLWFIPLGFYILLTLQSGISWLYFGLITAVCLIMYILSIILIPSIRWERWRYDVSDQEIDLLRGIIIRKRTLVPINRIQHALKRC